MIKSKVKIKHFSIVGLMSPGWVRTQVRTHSNFCWTRGLGLGLLPTGLGLGFGLLSNGLDSDWDSGPVDSDSHLMDSDSDLMDSDSDSDSGLVDSDSLPDSRVRTHSNTAKEYQ